MSGNIDYDDNNYYDDNNHRKKMKIDNDNNIKKHIFQTQEYLENNFYGNKELKAKQLKEIYKKIRKYEILNDCKKLKIYDDQLYELFIGLETDQTIYTLKTQNVIYKCILKNTFIESLEKIFDQDLKYIIKYFILETLIVKLKLQFLIDGNIDNYYQFIE